MNVKKNNVIKLLIAILIILIYISVVLIINFRKNIDSSNNAIEQSSEVVELSDQNIYFSLKDIIEDYYDKVCNHSYIDVVKYLDNNYIISNGISEENYYNYSDFNYYDIQYIIQNVYYTKNIDEDYYFLQGKTLSYCIGDSPTRIDNNIYYLVKVKNGFFSITPLDININFTNYVHNYRFEPSEISNNSVNKFPSKKISDNLKAEYYLSYYITELMEETYNAFDMLDSKTKNNYKSLDEFLMDYTNIYELIKSKPISINTDNDKIIIKFKNGHTVEFIENGVMNFKVNID